MRYLISILLISSTLLAQSAYYRLGYGDLYPTSDPLSSSLGQGMVALYDSARATTNNAASLHDLDRVYYTVGLGSEYRSIDNNVSNNTRFEHISLVVPVGKKSGLSIGAVPVADFKTYYQSEVADGTLAESSSGGIWDYHLGFGYQVSDKMSLGLKLHVLNGFLRRASSIETGDASETYVLKGGISGRSLELGMISQFGNKVTLGLTADIPYAMPMMDGQDSLAGTDEFIEVSEELSAWPTTIRFGLVYKQSKRTNIIAGIGQQIFPSSGFDNAKIYALPAGWQTVPAATFQVALQRLPADRNSRSFVRRVGYQIGASAKNYYLVSDPETFTNEYALISGINFGLRNGKSIFDISGEIGSRAGEETLPSELYARMKFGIQVNDIWFKKAKRR
jgi:hypothetical protein